MLEILGGFATRILWFAMGFAFAAILGAASRNSD